MKDPIIYKVETFEGPLDLLLNLISKNKMKIEDIKISIICDQYMEYMHSMEALDIELTSEFVVMASHLMLLKSRTLLPRNDESQDEDLEELKLALRERERIKEASSKIKPLYALYNGRMEKDTDEISPDRTYVAEHDVNLLTSALLKILSNFEVTDAVAEEKIKPLISTRTISVSERVFAILRILIMNDGYINVIKCFNGVHTKHEAVATFMALLEMLKSGRITINVESSGPEVDGVVNLSNDVYINLYTGKIRTSEENNG